MCYNMHQHGCTLAVLIKCRAWVYSRSVLQANCLTLEESEDPINTMSTEQPGKSSTREGLRLNTGFTDPLPKMSFFLGVEMGGRMVRPDKFPPLQLCVEARNPSVRQYNRCVRWPWLVSLKWYWHDPGLKQQTEDSKKVKHIVSTLL